MHSVCQPLLQYYSEQMDDILALSVIGAYILVGRSWDNITTSGKAVPGPRCAVRLRPDWDGRRGWLRMCFKAPASLTFLSLSKGISVAEPNIASLLERGPQPWLMREAIP